MMVEQLATAAARPILDMVVLRISNMLTSCLWILSVECVMCILFSVVTQKEKICYVIPLGHFIEELDPAMGSKVVTMENVEPSMGSASSTGSWSVVVDLDMAGVFT